MMKWVGIVGVVILVLGGLMLAGVLEMAAGLVKLGFFLALALVALLVFAGWRMKRRAGRSG